MPSIPDREETESKHPLQSASQPNDCPSWKLHHCSTVEQPLAAPKGEGGIPSPLCSIDLTEATTWHEMGFSVAQIGFPTDG